MSEPYPIVLEPILMPKVWGGRRLERLGKRLPAGEMVGESWEVADLDATSASGGGGGAARSVIANGPLAGRTLRDAALAWGERAGWSGPFPLLVKYLDAREHLSVQVHPSPAYAAAHPGAHLKTESWVVLDAEPGPDGSPPVIYTGLRPGVTREDLRAAIEGGRVPDVLVAVPAVVGACHTLPSGTVHALGAGVLVAEVQTPSDTTFRVYDWAREYARPERELHVEQALDSALFDDPPAPALPEGKRSPLADTAFYRIESVRGDCEAVPLLAPPSPGTSKPGALKPGAPATGSPSAHPEAPATGSPLVVMVMRTMGAAIASRSNRFAELPLERGVTCVVPACLAEDAILRCGPDTRALIARPA